MIKQTILSVSIATIICTTLPTAQATVITTNWDGLFTMISPDGTNLGFQNTSRPYYDDPTWGYGVRTQISGSLTYDSVSGLGTGSISGFSWGNAGIWQTHDLTLQAVGDGSGGSGDLIMGEMLYDWNGRANLPVSVIWDASGFLNAGSYAVGQTITNTGVAPASDNILTNYQIGPSPFATTTIDSVFPISDDGIAGTPLFGGGYDSFNPNIDITSMTVVSVSSVPIPASIWLFGSGLIGLIGIAKRKIKA